MRWMLFLVSVLLVSPCFGQKGKQPETYGVGDRFRLATSIVVAADEAESNELARSIEAGDKEGVKQMISEKRAIKLDTGVELTVLEISKVGAVRMDKSAVCRAIKDGKAIGKYPVHYTWFKSMKKIVEK